MADSNLQFNIWERRKGDRVIREVGRDASKSALDIQKFNTIAGKSFSTLSGAVQGLLKPVAAVASAGSALTGFAAPAAAGLAKVATAGVHLGLTLAPLAASLPALAGGFVLLKSTVTSTGPAMAKALAPIPTYFEKNQAVVDRLATRGLPQLARAFVKVNAPVIGDGMERIARATNLVVRDVGKWVNSTSGQKAIKTIVDGTADAAEKLAPHVAAVAVAFGDLVGRAGGKAFPRIADALATAADNSTEFLNSITSDKLDAAWRKYDQIAGVVKDLPAKFSALHTELQRGVDWWKQNADQIERAHNALAGVAIVAGALSGQWLPALAGAASLISTNWGAITQAAQDVEGWFTRLYNSATPVGSILRQLVDAGKAWGREFAGIVDWLKPLVPPLMEQLTQLGSDLAEALRLSMPAIKVFGLLVEKILGAAAATLGLLLIAAVVFVDGWVQAFNLLVKLTGHAVRGVLVFVSDLLQGIGKALSALPGPFHDMGVKLQNAANDVWNAAQSIQRYINGIHGKTIEVNVVTNYKTGVGTPSAGLKVGYRASGGPVTKGRPYIVGEQGPELFMPGANGAISSAAATRWMTRIAPQSPGTIASAGRNGGDLHVHLTVVNNGMIGSQGQIDDMLARGIDRLRRQNRLPRAA